MKRIDTREQLDKDLRMFETALESTNVMMSFLDTKLEESYDYMEDSEIEMCKSTMAMLKRFVTASGRIAIMQAESAWETRQEISEIKKTLEKLAKK